MITIPSNRAIAKLPDVSFSSCIQQINNNLKQWNSQDNWKKSLSINGQFQYYSATQDVGVWILIEMIGSDQLTLQRVETQSVSTFTYKKNDCLAKMEVNTYHGSVLNSAVITDSDISQFVSKNKNGLIYTWSPAMPFSVNGLEEVQKLSKQENLKLLVVLDPLANSQQAKKIIEIKKWPAEYLHKSISTDLKFRNLYNHYPSVVFFKNGEIKDTLIPGYKLAVGYLNEYRLLK